MKQDREFSIWWLWWRPWLTLRLPAVWFAILTYGVCLGWQIIQSSINGVVFPALYNFSPLGVGNISCAVRHRGLRLHHRIIDPENSTWLHRSSAAGLVDRSLTG